jgi:hypothetical protein
VGARVSCTAGDHDVQPMARRVLNTLSGARHAEIVRTGSPNVRRVSDELYGPAFGSSGSGGRTAISKSQRRHFQVSTVMVEGRDLLNTMVIPQLGQILSRGRLLGVAMTRLCNAAGQMRLI